MRSLRKYIRSYDNLYCELRICGILTCRRESSHLLIEPYFFAPFGYYSVSEKTSVSDCVRDVYYAVGSYHIELDDNIAVRCGNEFLLYTNADLKLTILL